MTNHIDPQTNYFPEFEYVSSPKAKAKVVEWEVLGKKHQLCWLDRYLTDAWNAIVKIISTAFRWLTCCCRKETPTYTDPKLDLKAIFSGKEISEMKAAWWALGDQKWKETIDGEYHKHGKKVFDEGRHGRAVEPGFIGSIENNLYPLIEKHLGTRTTSDLTLAVHRAACWHFDGKWTHTLMGRDLIGVFRDKGYFVHTNYGEKPKEFSKDDWNEFVVQNPSLGKIRYTDETKKTVRLIYREFSSKQVRELLDRYFNNFYQEIEAAGDDRTKRLTAIMRLAKLMFWLHPPRDGSLRTCLTILQKHLCEYIGQQAIFHDPHIVSKLSLDNLVKYMEDSALPAWKKLATSKV